MIRTHILECHRDRVESDALNRASGERYAQVLIFHWRTYRHTGHWLSSTGAERWNDRVNAGRPTILQAHSIDAAQQGFPKACTTARECRKAGLETCYPYKRKTYRTTIWKQSGIRVKGHTLLLARARGLLPIRIAVPDTIRDALRILEVRLVYDKAKRRYCWHVVLENGKQPKDAPGTNVMAVDLGEIHPAAMSDGQTNVVITCRELRSKRQYTQKRLAALRSRQSKCKQGSRLWKRIQKRISRFLAQQERRTRDLEHKISRAVVNVADSQKAGTIAIGDVRDAADRVKLGKQANQKISNWSHGKLRQYITYKAAAEGITTELVDEHDTSRTCPACGCRHKPHGRIYSCGQCGFRGHRDVVGAVNILSRYQHGEPGQIRPADSMMYRIPFNKRVLRSPLDTGHVACGQPQEAAPL